MTMFKSEAELRKFIAGHTPFAVKPNRDSKYMFVNPFKTVHGREAVINHITEQLWIKLSKNDE